MFLDTKSRWRISTVSDNCVGELVEREGGYEKLVGSRRFRESGNIDDQMRLEYLILRQCTHEGVT